MYYVYEWYIVETGEIIYVGKGVRNRYKVRKHNKLFNEIIRRFICDSRIVKEFDTEKEAFDYEFIRINELQDIGQCVCNIRHGGYGGSTNWWTDEMRKRYSEKNVMKSELQRNRMKEKNPMKKNDIVAKVVSKKEKAVIIGDKEYKSVKDACKEYKTSSEVIANWCKKGVNQHGEKCRYKGHDQVEFTGKRYNKGGSKAIIYKDKQYESIKDFASEIGIGQRTAHEWLKRGFSPNGTPVRYLNDERELVFVNKYTVRNKAKSKPILVNGVEYISCIDASEKLGIPKSTLYAYLRNERFNSEYICKYGNQHPSRAKSDNSSTKGSTTNG